MTPEAENTLFEDIGSIKTGIENINEKLAEHMDSDRENFKALGTRLGELDMKIGDLENHEIEGIKLAIAEQRGVAKARSTFLGVAGGLLSFIGIETIKKFFGV